MSESLTLSSILDWASYRRVKRLENVADIKMPGKLFPGTFKFKRKGHGEYIIPSSSPLSFSRFDQSTLEEVWCRLLKSDFDFTILQDICPYDLIFEIKRVYYALRFWWMTPGSKRYSVNEILRRSLLEGPTFSELLSDEWDFGIRRKFRIRGLFSDYMSWKPIEHYNELPPIAYLIRWEESSTDIDYMKIPLEPFDKDLLEELRNEILDSLPDSLELPSDVEILAEVKTSTTLDLEKMKSTPFFQGRLTPLGNEFSHIFKGKRSIIPVGPANTRDAVVTTIDTYNSIKWCDLVIGTLLDDEEESLVNSNSQVFNRRLRRMTRIPRQGEMFWLRDIKKCGLTFPRELFHIVQECLSEKFPDKDFSRFDIYRYYSIWDVDNKPIKTVRGYCLGMANNLVTYIQCMISKILLKRIPPHIEVEALYGNDDSCLKVWAKGEILDHVDAMMIQCEDFEILKGLNIITNDKKSFWSWHPILFEEYGHEDFKIKHSRIACALSSAMLAPDIKYAKLLTSSISQGLWDPGDWLVKPLGELIAKWGYEYYPEEVNYDYLLGGWISIRSKGMNPMLRMIDEAPLELIVPMWTAANKMNVFQKEVIRPILEGSVTKNYSVTGTILNITYVDTEIYDIPELPLETLYLNRQSYKKFYESIYRFNRFPYAEMAKRLRRVSSYKVDYILDRYAFKLFCLRNFKKLAIPKSFVLAETYIYEIRKDENLDCSSLMRNCLSRYIMDLKAKNLLMCPDLGVPASGEYPYVVNYDATPFNEKIEGITTLDGDMPDGIYQYSTNPWLPLYEYVMEYDQFPTMLSRIVEDKAHLPIWFMNKKYRDSKEVSIAYHMICCGEAAVDEILGLLREIRQAKDPAEKEISLNPKICFFCNMGHNPNHDTKDDIYNLQDDTCMMCLLGDHLWRARRLSTMASSIEERIENSVQVPILRSRIRYVIAHHFPALTESTDRYIQSIDDPETSFFAQEDEEGALFDMFGD